MIKSSVATIAIKRQTIVISTTNRYRVFPYGNQLNKIETLDLALQYAQTIADHVNLVSELDSSKAVF